MNRITKTLIWAFILSLSFGFRLNSRAKWDISKSDPTLWVKLCSSNFTIAENDVYWGDPLQGLTNLTADQILQTIIDDYNSVPTSYLRLAKYPSDPNNPGAPLAGDSAFTITKASTRTIEICFGATDSRVTSGGYAKPEIEGNKIVGCEIRAKTSFLNKASIATHLIAHEMGHCIGLNHPQDGTSSMMSYFTTEDRIKMRIQDDDRAGFTYLYPEESSYADEAATFGLSGCEPKDN